MVTWYKHDIPAWMDSTEALPDGAYRAHHVICQLIYLNEGPIRLNEQGIAGRCNQHILTFRKNLNLLLTSALLTLNPDQTLSQPRANLELERIGRNRVNAGLGGRAKYKSLKNNDLDLAPLKDTSAHKTRLEKTIEEKKDAAYAAPGTETYLFSRGKEILGKTSGGMIKQLLAAKEGKLNLAIAAIETAAGKQSPREYIGAIIRNNQPPAGEVSTYVDGRL